jgi:PPIC-type PPIASE domain
MIKRLLKEPLLHFLLLGAVLFAAHGILSRGGASEPGRIVVTQGQIESLAMVFARTWQRLPTDEELQGLIRSYVREEVLYREGLAQGLDRDDPIIRRRVAQKLEFIAENGEAAEPSDKELQAYLDSHRTEFAAEPQFTFRHVYLDPRRREKTLAADAERMLNELNSLGSSLDPAGLGDSTMLPLHFDNASASEVKKVLGDEFVKSLAQLAPGRWAGPVESEYGTHLVQVSKLTELRNPALAEVREAVKREWARTRSVDAIEKFFQNLLQRYTVTIERPQIVRGVSDDRTKQQ